MEEDEVVKNVRLAERALEKGEARKALRLLDAEHYMTSSRPLLAKIETIKAVAQLRTGNQSEPSASFEECLRRIATTPS